MFSRGLICHDNINLSCVRHGERFYSSPRPRWRVASKEAIRARANTCNQFDSNDMTSERRMNHKGRVVCVAMASLIRLPNSIPNILAGKSFNQSSKIVPNANKVPWFIRPFTIDICISFQWLQGKPTMIIIIFRNHPPRCMPLDMFHIVGT